MKLKNLYREYRTAIIKSRFMGYDEQTGKILFDTYRSRDEVVNLYSEYEVKALWAEIVTEKGSGFHQIAKPTIKIMLSGGNKDENENQCR